MTMEKNLEVESDGAGTDLLLVSLSSSVALPSKHPLPSNWFSPAVWPTRQTCRGLYFWNSCRPAIRKATAEQNTYSINIGRVGLRQRRSTARSEFLSHSSMENRIGLIRESEKIVRSRYPVCSLWSCLELAI